ncbi:MAG: hypothetical protein IK099_05985 [Clostridia bacterium]|nr:hypothetical protein [Clostridia bacterium]
MLSIACNLISEDEIPEEGPEQLDLFTDYEALEREKAERKAAEEKERNLQRVTLLIQERYGKNAMLKGMNFLEGGTTRERNGQIGGHRAGTDEMDDSFRLNKTGAATAADSQEEGEWE